MARVTPAVAKKISIHNAAQYCGVSERTIRNWIATGALPAYKYGNKLVRIDLDDLESLGRRIPAGRAC